MAAPVGTPTTGGRTATGTFTMALPTGATGFIAAVERKAGSVTPPAGWTLLQSVVRDSTWSVNEIYTAGASAGTSWSFTGTGTPAGIAVVILGVDGTPTVEQHANAASLTCPTTAATAGAALIVRVAFNQPAVGTAPTWTYPTAATLARQSAFQTLSSEGWAVAVSASQQAAAGAPGTAAYSASPTFGVGSWTLAITTPSGGTVHGFSGTTAATSATSAALSVALLLSGATAVTSGTTGNLTRNAATVSLSGATAATSGTSADLTRTPATVALSGTVAATSATSGDLSRTPATVGLSGTASSTSNTTGALTIRVGLSGAADATSYTSGDLTRTPRTHALSGTVAATSDTSGNLTVVGGPQVHSLAGTTSVASGTSGALALSVSMSGVTASATSTSGVLAVTHAFSGTMTATSGTSGDLALRDANAGAPVPNGALTLTQPASRLALTMPSGDLELHGSSHLTLTVPTTRLEMT